MSACMMTIRVPCGEVVEFGAERRAVGDKLPLVYCAFKDLENYTCGHVRYCAICGSRYCEAEVVAIEEKEEAS